MDTTLTWGVQDSLLTLLAFDENLSPVVRGMLEPSSYDAPYYSTIAGELVKYIDEYKKPPGEHTQLIIERIKKMRPKEVTEFDTIFASMQETRGSIKDPTYVLKQAKLFVRRQRINEVCTKVLEKQRGNISETEIVEMENLMTGVGDQKDLLADLGTSIREPEKFLRFLESDSREVFPTAIKELDSEQIGPSRGKTFLIMADTNVGKSWACVHLVKHSGILAGNKTLVVTCEMSEEDYCERIAQCLFSVSLKQLESHTYTKFIKGEEGTVIEFKEKTIKGRPSLADENIREVISKNLKQWKRSHLMVKQFPSGELTVPMLEAYLSSLEWHEKYLPDLVILDLPVEMAYDPKHERTELESIVRRLNGLAYRRNFALVIPWQANREGSGQKSLQKRHAASAYGIQRTVATGITLNQTKEEGDNGWMRIGTLKVRRGRKGFQVLISQSLDTGQFCMDSVRMTRPVKDLMNEQKEGEDDE